MRILLDTNIIIHREAAKVIKDNIGVLFRWFDRLSFQKCIHPLSVMEIKRHQEQAVVSTILAKLKNYVDLKTEAPEVPEIQALRREYDRTDNDTIDTSILKEVFCCRVDLLITEDRAIHMKARRLEISERVFTIDDFLEKVTAENPELTDYGVLSVKKEFFGNVNLSDPFFDTLKADYEGFEDWFNRKSDETAYICKSGSDELLAFLYLKLEGPSEPYHDIEPSFTPQCRLKIGTFKVVLNGYKLGERFLKIVFDNALQLRAEEIYVTIFNNTTDQERLIYLLEDWGFRYHGLKLTGSGEELVYVRDFSPRANPDDPALTYPFMSRRPHKFIVPIYPEYHTELFPDSILKTESPADFVENRPNRNAIRKVYISRSIQRDLHAGDIIVFYRTKCGGPAHYTAVTTTIGIVEEVIFDISSLEQFIALCRRRSVFSDADLAKHWNYNTRNRPFVVNFLYVHSFPKRLNLTTLKKRGIIVDAPRGFEPITDVAFQLLMEGSNAESRLVVD
jgi:predicted nucleic acid-binding protein